MFGEVFNLRLGRARVWFELRDGTGALPCSMWREDYDALASRPRTGPRRRRGRCDFYPGSRTASPAFSFAVSDVRIAGEGDLLAQLERLRRALYAEGLCEPQKQLPRPALPRCIGVVTGEGGKARDDVLAGLRRRGWAGRVVWAFAPVQDRRAAPAVIRALQDLAACPEVEVIVVARGGGSPADLFAFCDETLCRTVALLRVPVIASVGHHTDRTLIDDVAAVSCSTPTHAAEAAVPVDCARRPRGAARPRGAPRAPGAPRDRRPRPGARAASRAPADHVARHRTRLHQHLRELRAGAHRGLADRRSDSPPGRSAGAARRRHACTARAAGPANAGRRRGAGPRRDHGTARRAADLDRLRIALAAHDPQRTLERGYALVEDPGGAPVTSAAAAAGHALSRFGSRTGRRRAARDRRPTRRDPPRRRAPAPAAETPPRAGHRRPPAALPPTLLPVLQADPPPSPRSPTSPPARASKPSSAGSTPARPACARRWSCARRAAASSSSARRSSRPWARAWRSCGWTSWSPGWKPDAPRPDRRGLTAAA